MNKIELLEGILSLLKITKLFGDSKNPGSFLASLGIIVALVLGVFFLIAFLRRLPKLSEAQKWALAIPAILTEGNKEKHFLLSAVPINSKNIKAYNKLLNEWWGIYHREDLLKTMNWLKTIGHQSEFHLIKNELLPLSPAQRREWLRSHNERIHDLENKIQVIEKYKQKIGYKGIYAWDLSRVVALCRWGFLVGYLSEAEAWALILPEARKLQRMFRSWEELGENWLIGREFWSKKETQESGNYYRGIYYKLLKDPKSPWRTLSWNLSLSETNHREFR